MHDPFAPDDDMSIDLTPLIDVIFMLLVFFIMTTTFSKPVLDIILPSADNAAEAPRQTAEMVISIKADGSMSHDSREMDHETLAELLATRPEALLNLHVDEKAPFEAFVEVIDLARKLRNGKFVISTRSPGA